MTMKNAIAPLAIAALATLPTLAAAQGLGGLLRDTGLKTEDYDMMRAAAAELYTAESPAIGDETIWKNTETGSFGTVEITALDDTCANVRHLARAGNSRTTVPFEARWCKGADGTWTREQQ